MGSKYPVLRPNEIISALSKKGFSFKSKKGSHAKYTNGKNIYVIPMHDTVAKGTLKSILIQAEVDLDEFIKLL
jgi:predicted RNA binding protein YcfA (HicA-like mRNA interferase family)